MNATGTILPIVEIQHKVINPGSQKQNQQIHHHGLVELELETDARAECPQLLVVGEQLERPHFGFLVAAGTGFAAPGVPTR